MDREVSWREAVRPVAEAALAAGSVPGAVIAVAVGDRAPEYLVLGTDADGQPLAPDSLFPIASVTKLAVALAVLRLAADGRLALDDPLARHLPYSAAAGAGVTLRALLCHTAGMPGDLAPGSAPYEPGLTWPALARACLATRPMQPPGTSVQYSNLDSGLLAVVVERRTGQPFRTALGDLVLRPLGIDGYLGVEPPRPPARITGELGPHAGTELDPYNSAFWRSLALPWGGMLATAAGALRLVRAFAGQPPGFLPAALLAEATHDQTGGLGGGFWDPWLWTSCPWGLGPELRGTKDPHWAPASASPVSFGHSGASGCLVWCDPAPNMAWAILGTRTFERWWRAWPPIGDAVLAGGRGPDAKHAARVEARGDSISQ